MNPIPDNACLSVLVVDDEPGVRQSFSLYLEDQGHEVSTASDGRAALGLLDGQSFDLILLDLRMPQVSGLSVLEHVRGRLPNTPVIVISATGRIADVVEALRLGAWDYLTKPIEEMAVLDHAIRGAIQKARLIAQADNHRLELEREVEARTRELSELSMHLETIREQEKRRIAREIHDDLGVTLTSLNTEVSLLRNALADRAPELQGRFSTIKELVSDSLDISRRIISDLRPSILDTLGLVAALEWQAAEFTKRFGIEVNFSSNSDTVCMDEERSIALFRIFQESINNVVKHAEASSIYASIDTDSHNIRMLIRDDGTGFDTARLRPKSHGIRGMRERVRNLGGSFEITSDTETGTEVCVCMQLMGEEAGTC